MGRAKVILQNPDGLNERYASLLVKEALKYTCKLIVRYKEKAADTKNIMGLLILEAKEGEELEIIADGPDEAEAVEALVKFINHGTQE